MACVMVAGNSWMGVGSSRLLNLGGSSSSRCRGFGDDAAVVDFEEVSVLEFPSIALRRCQRRLTVFLMIYGL